MQRVAVAPSSGSAWTRRRAHQPVGQPAPPVKNAWKHSPWAASASLDPSVVDDDSKVGVVANAPLASVDGYSDASREPTNGATSTAELLFDRPPASLAAGVSLRHRGLGRVRRFTGGVLRTGVNSALRSGVMPGMSGAIRQREAYSRIGLGSCTETTGMTEHSQDGLACLLLPCSRFLTHFHSIIAALGPGGLPGQLAICDSSLAVVRSGRDTINRSRSVAQLLADAAFGALTLPGASSSVGVAALVPTAAAALARVASPSDASSPYAARLPKDSPDVLALASSLSSAGNHKCVLVVSPEAATVAVVRAWATRAAALESRTELDLDPLHAEASDFVAKHRQEAAAVVAAKLTSLWNRLTVAPDSLTASTSGVATAMASAALATTGTGSSDDSHDSDMSGQVADSKASTSASASSMLATTAAVDVNWPSSLWAITPAEMCQLVSRLTRQGKLQPGVSPSVATAMEDTLTNRWHRRRQASIQQAMVVDAADTTAVGIASTTAQMKPAHEQLFPSHWSERQADMALHAGHAMCGRIVVDGSWRLQRNQARSSHLAEADQWLSDSDEEDDDDEDSGDGHGKTVQVAPSRLHGRGSWVRLVSDRARLTAWLKDTAVPIDLFLSGSVAGVRPGPGAAYVDVRLPLERLRNRGLPDDQVVVLPVLLADARGICARVVRVQRRKLETAVVTVLPRAGLEALQHELGAVSSMAEDEQDEDEGGGDGPNAQNHDAETASTAAGHTRSGGQKWVIAVPMDRRFPAVRLPLPAASERSLVGRRLLVQLTGWAANDRLPKASLVRSLGRAGRLEAELRAALSVTGASGHARPFSMQQRKTLPTLDADGRWLLPPAPTDSKPPVNLPTKLQATLAACVRGDRLDLRGTLPILSVDPPGCRDIDDALSARMASPGMLIVGVHIADVSHFVPTGSALDGEARSRATTVYLPDRRMDMLPPELCEVACSLRARAPRYAMSMLWGIQVVGWSWGKEEGEEPTVPAHIKLSIAAQIAVKQCQSGCLEVDATGTALSSTTCAGLWEAMMAVPGAGPEFAVQPGDVWTGPSVVQSSHALTYAQAMRIASNIEAGGARGDAPLTPITQSDGSPWWTMGDASITGTACGVSGALASTASATHGLISGLRYHDPPAGGECGSPVYPTEQTMLRSPLVLLVCVARWLRRERGLGGAIELESTELRFRLAGKLKRSTSLAADDDAEAFGGASSTIPSGVAADTGDDDSSGTSDCETSLHTPGGQGPGIVYADSETGSATTGTASRSGSLVGSLAASHLAGVSVHHVSSKRSVKRSDEIAQLGVVLESLARASSSGTKTPVAADVDTMTPVAAGTVGAATAGTVGAATVGTVGAATAGTVGAATAGTVGAATAGTVRAATADTVGAATDAELSLAADAELSLAAASPIAVLNRVPSGQSEPAEQRRDQPGNMSLESGDDGAHEMHTCIAELMVLANCTAARRTLMAFPRLALLRRHRPARDARFSALLEAAEGAGVAMDTSSNATLAKSLAMLSAGTAVTRSGVVLSDASRQWLSSLATRAMEEAEYVAAGVADDEARASTDATDTSSVAGIHAKQALSSPTAVKQAAAMLFEPTEPMTDGVHVGDAHLCRRIYQPWLSSPFAHYGLGVQFYTHFTSPIRRYADVLVHRLLKQAVGAMAPATDASEAIQLDQARKARQQALTRSVDGMLSQSVLPVDGLLSAQSSEVSSMAEDDDGMLDNLFGTSSAAAAVTGKAIASSSFPASPAGSVMSSSEEESEGDDHLDALFLAAKPSQSTNLTDTIATAELDCHAIGNASGSFSREKQLPTSITGVVDIAARANLQTRAAKLASRACAEIFLSLWLRARCVVVEAVVTRIRCSSLDTIIAAAISATDAAESDTGVGSLAGTVDLNTPGLTVEVGLWCPRFDLRDRVDIVRQADGVSELLIPPCLTDHAAAGSAPVTVHKASWEKCNPACYQVPSRAGPAETEAAAVANARLGLLQDCGSLRAPVPACACDDVRLDVRTRLSQRGPDVGASNQEIDSLTISGTSGKWNFQRSHRVLCLAWCDMTRVHARPPSIQLSPLCGPVASFLARLSDTQDHRTATLPDAVTHSMAHGSIMQPDDELAPTAPATVPVNTAALATVPVNTAAASSSAVVNTSAGWAIAGKSLGIKYDSQSQVHCASRGAIAADIVSGGGNSKAVARGRWRLGGFQGRPHNRTARAWAAAVAPVAQAARVGTRRLEGDAGFESAHGMTSSQLLGDAHALREAKASAEARMHRQQAQKRNARIKEKRKQK